MLLFTPGWNRIFLQNHILHCEVGTLHIQRDSDRLLNGEEGDTVNKFNEFGSQEGAGVQG